MNEGQRVMRRPRTVDEADAGWEQPEGVVITAGRQWVVVRWDAEWGGNIQELKIEDLTPIEEVK